MFHGPTEILPKILSHCPLEDLKRLSLVSRRLRRQAALLLFRAVTIHLGIWEVEEDRRSDFKAINERKIKEAAMRSLEVLVGFEKNPLLAGSVRTLTIYAFTKSFLIFELYHVECLLSKTPSLEHFQWLGGSPAFPHSIADALARYCPSLCSASVIGLDDSTSTSLCSLNALRSLELVDPNEHTGEWDPAVDLKPQSLQTLINTHGGTLKTLSLPGHLASEVNILRSAHSLTHLCISQAGHCKGLDLFLQHSDVLESLIVLDCDTLAFLPTGRGAKKALPALRDLKLALSLITDPHVAPHHSSSVNLTKPHLDFRADSQTLLSFTTLHPNLQRFDFSIEPSKYFESGTSRMQDQRYNDQWFPNVVQAMCKIEAATALGLSFPKLSPQVLRKALVDIHDNGISWHCTALRLSGVAEASYKLITEDVLPFITRFKFLSLSNHRPLEDHPSLIPLPTLQSLVPIWSLELVCLNSMMHDMRDRRRLGKQAYWTREKIRFRSAADFPNEDAYWLMSHRLITWKYNYGPDMEYDDW